MISTTSRVRILASSMSRNKPSHWHGSRNRASDLGHRRQCKRPSCIPCCSTKCHPCCLTNQTHRIGCHCRSTHHRRCNTQCDASRPDSHQNSYAGHFHGSSQTSHRAIDPLPAMCKGTMRTEKYNSNRVLTYSTNKNSLSCRTAPDSGKMPCQNIARGIDVVHRAIPGPRHQGHF
jgi:hypothetical protein